MVAVQVGDDPRLGGHQRLGAGEVDQDVGRVEIDDAAEAGDQMGVRERDAIEREIPEAGKYLGFRLARQIAPPRLAVVGLKGAAC